MIFMPVSLLFMAYVLLPFTAHVRAHLNARPLIRLSWAFTYSLNTMTKTQHDGVQSDLLSSGPVPGILTQASGAGHYCLVCVETVGRLDRGWNGGK